ncbi:MAG: type I methionyl aminopeptidase [Alphaproteobacteria bacterium GWF2_58_20]|nr:MAG: type I methionyl aminopeptidase [Alphaproteobacteria bacterium GWF2_58_20]
MPLRKHTSNIPTFAEDGFAGMRASGRLAAETLDFITPHVVPGVSTEYINSLCETFIRDHGAIPAPLGYRGYPKATCISVNHVVCHGIPGERILVDGDIANIDITTILDGWYGDTSRMYLVGDNLSIKARRLVSATYEALMRGIAVCRPGVTVGDIGAAIEDYIHPLRFSIVEDFCGHGLGRDFHTRPNILHFGRKGTGEIMRPGMFFTIEPMINAGRKEVITLADGWTAVTRDKSLSAQFEHSIGITETGCEIFTLSPAGLTQPPYKVPA